MAHRLVAALNTQRRQSKLVTSSLAARRQLQQIDGCSRFENGSLAQCQGPVLHLRKGDKPMPLKLNVGASKKIGEPNYGSRGASVNLELELDATLISEPQKLKERIRQLFGLVRTSLADELNGDNGHGSSDHHAAPAPSRPSTNGNGSSQPTPPRTSQSRPATQSQIRAIHSIAHNQRIDLAIFLTERFRVRRPDDLSIKEASQVIDELKAAPRNGKEQ
jgi:hypothetical protein